MSEDRPSPEDVAAMAAPGPEHALLEPFVGTFEAEVRIWTGPGEPFVSRGTMVNRLDLGGRFLAQVYTGEPSAGPFPSFEGRGFFGYNRTDRRFESLWIDNASTMMQLEHGRVDATGRLFEMRGTLTDPKTGRPLARRTLLRLVDSDHHTMEMYFETPEGEVKAMEIRYTRKA